MPDSPSPLEERALQHLRPRFSLAVKDSRDAVLEKIQASLSDAECPCSGDVLPPGFVELFAAHQDRHFWSPWLSIKVLEVDGGSELHGKFGPHPNVWTLFAACYAAVTFSLVGTLCYGIAQWLLGKPPTFIWLALGFATLGAVLYVSSQIGQRLGHAQIETIRSFVVTTLVDDSKTPTSPDTEPPRS